MYDTNDNEINHLRQFYSSYKMKNLFQVLEMCSKMPKGLLDDFTYFYKSPKSLHTQLPDFSFKSLDPLRNAS